MDDPLEIFFPDINGNDLVPEREVSSVNAPNSSTSCLFDSLGSQLEHLHFTVDNVGAVRECRDASIEDFKEAFDIVDTMERGSSYTVNFAKGDLWLALGDRHGDRKKALVQMYGEERAAELYNGYCKCATIARKWPPHKRNPNLPWEYYRGKKQENKWNPDLFPKGKTVHLFIDGVPHPTGRMVVQNHRIVVIIDRKVVSTGREQVSDALKEVWNLIEGEVKPKLRYA
jgi:hypothetical protein